MPWRGTVAWGASTSAPDWGVGAPRQGRGGAPGERAPRRQAGEKTSTMRRAWCAAAGRTIGSLTPAAR